MSKQQNKQITSTPPKQPRANGAVMLNGFTMHTVPPPRPKTPKTK